MDLAYLPLAYIDPGSGSVVLQAIVAAIAGLLVAVKMYWRRIVSIFRPGSRRTQASERAED